MKRKATTMSTTDTTEISREIKYSRATRDYDCYVNGQYVGSARNYSEGEALCDQVAFDLIADGQCLTAAQLDGGSDADTCAAEVASMLVEVAQTDAAHASAPGCYAYLNTLAPMAVNPEALVIRGEDPTRVSACFSDPDWPTIGATALLEEADTVVGRLYCPNCLGDHLLQDCPLKRGDHTTEADTLLNQLANHPGPDCYCPACTRATDRLIVDVYMDRLRFDAGLAPRVCGNCGGQHSIQQCSDIRRLLFAA
jgi:hypothetical protein